MTREDFHTETWRRMAALLEGELASLRAKNDSKVLTEQETAFIRGRIEQVKRILSRAKVSDRQGDGPAE